MFQCGRRYGQLFMNIEKLLENVGLSTMERKVYVLLLQKGESAASVLAAKLLLPRTSVRRALDVLCERNLVTKIYKKNTQFYMALHPERLKNLVVKDIESKKQVLDQLGNSMSVLSSWFKNDNSVPKFRLFEGKEQVLEAFNMSLFKEGVDEILIFTSYGFLNDPIVRKNDDEFFMKMRIEKEIKARVLVEQNEVSVGMQLNVESELRQRKLLPVDFELPGNIHIYGDRVLYFDISDDGEYTALLFEGGMISKTMKSLFEFVWKTVEV